MGEHLQQLVVETEQTVEQLLESKGLSANNFFVTRQTEGSESGTLMSARDTISAGTKVKIIPKVAGGSL